MKALRRAENSFKEQPETIVEYLEGTGNEGTMEKLKNYILLHLTVMLFSFTSVFSKFASGYYKSGGFASPLFYVFLFLMLMTCAVYALVWQKVIKKFDLNVAYANRTVYLIWSQIWAVLIFHENLSINNIVGMVVVFIGVLVVIFHE